jgi:hypothetical protein
VKRQVSDDQRCLEDVFDDLRRDHASLVDLVGANDVEPSVKSFYCWLNDGPEEDV